MTMASRIKGKIAAVKVALVALALCTVLAPASARAIEVKKELNTGGGGGGPARPMAAGPSMHNPLTPAQQKVLQDAVATDSDPFIDQESDKKTSGEPYVDLEHAAFSYIPSNKGGGVTVVAKLTAGEYKLAKGGSGRGRSTGKKKSLIFNYKLDGSKFVASEPAKWEDVAAPAAAPKK
ncbi:MAG TPA: hypothetical protein VNF29_14875 [Candidatus Binataceae bacterium]|nr:hypothetical protein [Candidatus Binataceae bacterium]